MRWPGFLLSVVFTALPLCRSAAVSHVAASLGIQPGTTTTDSGIAIGFHLDWNGGDLPETLNARLGKPAAIIGGYIHLNTTNQTYSEMAQQIPAILPLASTIVYSPAVLPQFKLELWTQAMSNTLASQMASLNAQGITVWLRFAYEMNGAWMDFGQDPVEYVAVWQQVVTAVRAVAPSTYFLWSPNIYAPSVGGISGYSEYYPTAAYVDLAGISYYSLGGNQVQNDLAGPTDFSDSFQTFYDTYSPAHPIVISETSAPEHYIIPANSPYINLPSDSEIPGGADSLDFSQLVPANTTNDKTPVSEVTRKSTWFEEMTGAAAVALYPKLFAVMWFNLAKTGGYLDVIRLNDYRAVKTADDPVTQYFRTAIGNETAYQLNIVSSADSSSPFSTLSPTLAGSAVAKASGLTTSKASGSTRLQVCLVLGSAWLFGMLAVLV